eukprot:1688336-Ditylum_brightwellii.AAC.1
MQNAANLNIRFGIVAIKRTKEASAWYQLQLQMDLPCVPAESTVDERDEMMNWCKETNGHAKSKEDGPDKPELLKSSKGFEVFNEKIINYLGLVYGHTMVILSYLIQKQDEPEIAMHLAPYNTLEDYLICCMLHEDRWYTINNKSLWIILKELM